ncbi:hypothetical protein [Agrobacterium rosae]
MVSLVSVTQAYFVDPTGQNTKDESGAGFQLELEEQTFDTDETGSPVSIWDYQGPPLTSSFSSALWEIDAKIEPQTIEEQQKTLDIQSKELADEFLKFAEMTPAEKIRARALGEMDLTEEKLAALPPEERAAIEDKIAKAIERALGIDQITESTGTAETAEDP